MLPSETDFEPCSFLIHVAFGRLTPIGEEGETSPTPTTTVITFAEIPTTFFFLCSSIIGELSSNHCACLLIASILFVASRSLIETSDCHEPLCPSGSL